MCTFAGNAPETEYYVCRPDAFMQAVQRCLTESGIATERVHIERFTVDESNVGLPSVDIPEHVEISAEVRGRQKSFEHRRGLSLLHAVRRAELAPPSSCELGTCGTCMARLTEGEAAMRHNIVVSDEEVAEGWVLTCQAVPTSPVIRFVYE